MTDDIEFRGSNPSTVIKQHLIASSQSSHDRAERALSPKEEPMPSRIEDYAIIGDTKTVALVDLSGSIDWWCVPRIDSAAAFAALLGDSGNGRWLIAPKGEVTNVTRRYEPETLILETIFETATGTVSVSDFMPPYDGRPMIHRIVESRAGTVDMQMELSA